MVQIPWRQPPLTKRQADDLFMLMLEDDTEEAPWMTMGDLQFWAASGFAHSLRSHARRRRLPWYVASMLPIAYIWPPTARKRILSPDCFVAFVPERPRSSFDVEAEGGVFPPFVLEVVSPSSVERDQEEKRLAYELLGAREYALFTPRQGEASTLVGYRRDAAGLFTPWRPDERGRLWSVVLDLHLAANGPLLQAQTPDGRWLLTPEQADEALDQADEARERAEEARERAERAAAALRRELERLRGQAGA